MRLHILTEKIPWFGQHTGYDLLAPVLEKAGCTVKEYWPSPHIGRRSIGKIYSTVRGLGRRDQSASYVELCLYAGLIARPDVSHILYSELHLAYFTQWQRKAPRSTIGTIHLPPAQWNADMRAQLRRLSSAIVLYQRDLDFAEEHVGKGRVKCIHLGSDTDFFCPSNEPVQPRLLFAGHYLRNVTMLSRVITLLLEAVPEIQFDFLVPEARRDIPGLQELKLNSAITWHQGLSDEELRVLFRSSYLLLLPMSDSGANTAIVDALSCGLPVVTTDVGGIRDYGGGDQFPLVANNDDAAMVDLVLQYWRNESLRYEVSHACRQFAETKLAWPVVAAAHLEAYRQLIED